MQVYPLRPVPAARGRGRTAGRCRRYVASHTPQGYHPEQRGVAQGGAVKSKDEDHLPTNDGSGIPGGSRSGPAPSAPVAPTPAIAALLDSDRDGIARHEGDAIHLDATFRHSYSRDQATLVRRLRRIEGQVRGIEKMIERHEYCIDILQQTAALRAAVDSVALLILEDHVQGCVRTAAEHGDADRYIEEVLDVVRRTLGKPVRNPRV
jgi:DNA-binding FrmR family transcriptional regulator